MSSSIHIIQKKNLLLPNMHCTLFSKRHSSFKLEKFVILDQTKVYWNLCTLKQWPNFATFSKPLARLPNLCQDCQIYGMEARPVARLPNLWHGSQTCVTDAKSVSRIPDLCQCHGCQICVTDDTTWVTAAIPVARLPNLWHGSQTCGSRQPNLETKS